MMGYSPKTALLACALATTIPAAPIYAREMNSSEAYLFISGLVSVAIVFSPVAISEKMHDLSTRSSDCNCSSRRSAADSVPDMEVKQIVQDEGGIARVRLQAPDNPDIFATLSWPGQQDNPAAGFREGHMVSFQPSPQASGWLLRDEAGTALAFVPVEGMMRENHLSVF